MKLRFLLDENLSPRLHNGIARADPGIDILRIGQAEAPPLGTLDPDILRYLERTQRLLITDNRRTIPTHAADHIANEGHHWGIFFIRPTATMGQVIEEILLFWGASEAEEWIDQLRWIPL
jgi:hypothetical protein